MPKARKAGSAASTVSNAKLGRLFAETAAFADDDDDCSIGEDAYYAGGFGMRRGTVCHCSRCLRRSGPLTDDPGQVVDDIVNFFEDVDVDGTATGFDCGDLEEHHRLVAATTSLAVERGDADVLRTILSNLSDHGIQSELATRLAVPAAQHGHAHLIFLLDDFQADFEEPDPARGGPPLMHAANNGHVAAVNALLEEVHMRMYVRLSVDNHETIKHLWRRMLSVATTRKVHRPQDMNDEAGERVHIIVLQCGTDSEAADYQSQTALMVAVFSDRASAAEALLAKGAKVDAVDYKGRTALSHAARYGSLDCISVLAQHNADVFHVDKDGRTPIDIAEDCSRFEAAAQLKRLRQRQRLRVRKEMRQKDVGPDRKFDRLELMQKEAEALQHALALVEEEEHEAQQKARKQKARKAKKKAKAHDAAGTAAAVKDTSDAVNGIENGTVGSSRQDANEASADEEDAAPIEPATAAETAEVPTRASSSISQQASGLPEAEAEGALPDPKAEAQAENELSPADPVAQLRSDWDTLLKEAASCKDAHRQAILTAEVRTMVDKCVAAGVSVKYGKKILGKLEKASAVRSALAASLDGIRALDLGSLEDAVAQAKGLKSLLDDRLLEDAEQSLQKARQEAARCQRAEAPKGPSPQPVPMHIARANGHVAHAPSAGSLAAADRSWEEDPQPHRAQEAGASALPVAADGRPASGSTAASSQLPSSRILHSLGAQHSAPNGKASNVHHSNGRVNGLSEASTSRGPAPQRLPIAGGPPGYAQNGRGHSMQTPPPGMLSPHSRHEARPRPQDPAAAVPRLSTSPAPQMHEQGLASIWPRSMASTGPEPASLPQAPNQFFSGSLFEAPLALHRPAPSMAYSRQRPPSAEVPQSLFSAAQSNSWSPLEGREGGPQNWLGEILASQQQLPAAASHAPKAQSSSADIWSECFPSQGPAEGHPRVESTPLAVHRMWTNGDSMQRPAARPIPWNGAGPNADPGPQETRRPPEPRDSLAQTAGHLPDLHSRYVRRS